MDVTVTGGSGFVGCHTVAALVRAGHRVRLLVRSAGRVRPALEPLGVGDVEIVVGDVTDPRSVEQALRGVEAVIHCASVYSFEPRSNSAIQATNVPGTDLVLRTARQLGLDPIVHVSSFTALLGPKGATITVDSPPTAAPGAYSRSKADSDRVARRHQDD